MGPYISTILILVTLNLAVQLEFMLHVLESIVEYNKININSITIVS